MSKYIVVECVSQFLQKYVIEVPDDSKCSPIEYAEDTVTMGECREFSQKYLGETIINSREINIEEVIHLCNQENDYAKYWSDGHKLYNFVTEVGYKP